MRSAAVHPVFGDDSAKLAGTSSALVSILRGRFCDILLPGREAKFYEEDQILYELGDEQRVLYFVRSGVVKTGTITSDGREIIYDLRKEGDVVGELCALDTVRTDRAVALERTEAIPVAFDQVMEIVARDPAMLRDLIMIFGRALSEAYDQVNGLAVADVMHRLIKVLQGLANKFTFIMGPNQHRHVTCRQPSIPEPGMPLPGKAQKLHDLVRNPAGQKSFGVVQVWLIIKKPDGQRFVIIAGYA